MLVLCILWTILSPLLIKQVKGKIIYVNQCYSVCGDASMGRGGIDMDLIQKRTMKIKTGKGRKNSEKLIIKSSIEMMQSVNTKIKCNLLK